jgi:CubicO group peptidase (beta-lactamase class C family)
MQHVREVERTAAVSSGTDAFVPLQYAPAYLDDAEVFDAAGFRTTLAELLERTSTDGILLLKSGRVLYERYYRGMLPETPHLYHSISKSLTSCVAANLIESGLIDPEDLASAYAPELKGSAYGDATVRNLLDMSVAIRYTEDHEDFETEDSRLDRLCGVKPRRSPDEPGSAYEFATTTLKEGEHAAVFHYVSLNTDVLGWVMERATGLAMPRLLSSEVWSKLGTQDEAYIALDGAGTAQSDGGFCSSLRDLARFGQMLCLEGIVNGRRVVPDWWIRDTRTAGNKTTFAASQDAAMLPAGASYRNCFWVSERADHTTFMGLGMYGQMIYVNQKADVVIAKFSSQPRAADDELTAHTFHAFESLLPQLA